jgi:diguanylate cyclase (GGDEF)-like protein
VLQRFVSRLPDRIEEMQRLLHQEELQPLARAIHQIKGAAGGYGFPDLTTAAGRAEETIKQAEDLPAIAAQVEELIGMIRRVDGFPHATLKSIPSLAAPANSTPPGATTAPQPAPEPAPAPRTHVDAATGLPNRNNLLDRLSGAIANARRQRSPLACFTITVDRFSEIQGNYGSDAGHRLIRHLACAIEEGWETEVEVFRADASTLAMILSPSGDDGCRTLAGQIGALIAETRVASVVGDRNLTCKIGIGELKLTTTCAAELLAAAVRSAGGSFSQPPTSIGT